MTVPAAPRAAARPAIERPAEVRPPRVARIPRGAHQILDERCGFPPFVQEEEDRRGRDNRRLRSRPNREGLLKCGQSFRDFATLPVQAAGEGPGQIVVIAVRGEGRHPLPHSDRRIRLQRVLQHGSEVERRIPMQMRRRTLQNLAIRARRRFELRREICRVLAQERAWGIGERNPRLSAVSVDEVLAGQAPRELQIHVVGKPIPGVAKVGVWRCPPPGNGQVPVLAPLEHLPKPRGLASPLVHRWRTEQKRHGCPVPVVLPLASRATQTIAAHLEHLIGRYPINFEENRRHFERKGGSDVRGFRSEQLTEVFGNRLRLLARQTECPDSGDAGVVIAGLVHSERPANLRRLRRTTALGGHIE
jgi:hypothetical protein